MIRTRPLALALALAAAALACSPHRIPGTQIKETPDTKAVYDVLQAYRQAMEKKDAAAVLALVAPDYFDNAGSPEPADDVDRAKLEQVLPTDLARAETIKLDFTIRDIWVSGNQAVAELFYEQYYRVVTPGGAVPRRDSDVSRMTFVKVNGAWKIQSGL